MLEKNGFTVERNYRRHPHRVGGDLGIGKPVIALGSDIDCIPQASQKPGVAYHDPLSRARRATARATTPACR